MFRLYHIKYLIYFILPYSRWTHITKTKFNFTLYDPAAEGGGIHIVYDCSEGAESLYTTEYPRSRPFGEGKI